MKIQYNLFLLFFLFVAGCSPNTSGQYKYQVPAQLQDGLNPATLTEVGMDTSLLFKAMDKIFAGRYKGVHSVLIYTDNKLVLEEYFDGYAYKWDGPGHHGAYVSWDRSKLHYNMSATKSITSACVGIAIDQGFIESVDQSIFDFLPAHRHLSKGKKKITIENLLTMTAGLQWKEWSAPYSSTENPVIGVWFQEKDPITYILEKPIIEDPGKTFNYSTGI